MSTINDLELSELLTKIHLEDAVLSCWCRNGKEAALFRSLLNIHRAAEDAMHRLNELKPK